MKIDAVNPQAAADKRKIKKHNPFKKDAPTPQRALRVIT